MELCLYYLEKIEHCFGLVSERKMSVRHYGLDTLRIVYHCLVHIDSWQSMDPQLSILEKAMLKVRGGYWLK